MSTAAACAPPADRSARRPASSKPALRTLLAQLSEPPGLRDPHGSVDRRAAVLPGGAWRVWLLRADGKARA